MATNIRNNSYSIVGFTRHSRGEPDYRRLLERMVDIDQEPEILTQLTIRVPCCRRFDDRALSEIDAELTPLIKDQRCLQFRDQPILRARYFWHEGEPILSGESAVHLYAHLMLSCISIRRESLLLSPETTVFERIFRLFPGKREFLTVAFAGDLDFQSFREVATTLWIAFENKVLSLGVVVDHYCAASR